eukprot:723627-Prymnesium_polylepis.1
MRSPPVARSIVLGLRRRAVSFLHPTLSNSYVAPPRGAFGYLADGGCVVGGLQPGGADDTNVRVQAWQQQSPYPHGEGTRDVAASGARCGGARTARRLPSDTATQAATSQRASRLKSWPS